MNPEDPIVASLAGSLVALATLWAVVCAIISIASGWRGLARQFPVTDLPDGERLRFVSAGIGPGSWPASYRRCLQLTLGTRGLWLSVLWPFSFMHPPLFVPWTGVEGVSRRRFWYLQVVEMRLRSSPVRIMMRGTVGEKLLAAYSIHGAHDGGLQ